MIRWLFRPEENQGNPPRLIYLRLQNILLVEGFHWVAASLHDFYLILAKQAAPVIAGEEVRVTNYALKEAEL